MKTKDEILAQWFYPHECGSMIECVTRKQALEAMEEYASQHTTTSPPVANDAGELTEEDIETLDGIRTAMIQVNKFRANEKNKRDENRNH